MPTDHRAALREIKTFPQLLKYLGEEMNWPVDRLEIDELTFDYSPEELGIDPKNAAKIQEIKRLRPLSVNQPWGIFFIKFAPSKLPVVALRRILGQVVMKKRASAKDADRSRWSAGDLLFISNYGEGDARQITFAHFSQAEAKNDLPTLKVLGWDNLDTPLHLDQVARELTEQLAWPEDEKNIEEWRKRWRSAFTLGHREVITTSKQLSIALAKLAKNIRDRINTALKIETERGPLTKLMNAFRESLLHDLKPDDFADMYAQTIAYGLLSARITDPESKTADDFARHMRTNPFLRELMETFLHVGGRRGKKGDAAIDFDELGVNDVVELLDEAKMDRVVADFGDKNPQEDPVIHFYELFLKEYDAKKRMQRGVFYTPRPVVSYIVRSVDELLRTEFGLEDGLADTTTWGKMADRNKDLKIPEGTSPDQPFVQILDPACGTGTFLVEVIDIVHKTMIAKWQKAGHHGGKLAELWNDYVSGFLLPRLHGYELLMAPYAIAHLKIGLKLLEAGYHFDSDERARIFLTNALEQPSDVQFRLSAMPALAHEAQAVNEIKRRQRFTLVIGNPPYAGISSNMTEEAQRIVDAYRVVDGVALNEKKVWLQDDYVKFIRRAQSTISDAGAGVVGFITNHGYLDNPTFRGMRQSVLQTFAHLSVIDLHGNANKKEQSPDGSDDTNVFDIRQGVAICLATRRAASPTVQHAELWGSREGKYRWLTNHSVGNTLFTALKLESPYYFLEPQRLENDPIYERATPIDQMFSLSNSGIVTARDGLVLDLDLPVLRKRIADFRNPDFSDSEIQARFGLSENYMWRVSDARKQLMCIGSA